MKTAIIISVIIIALLGIIAFIFERLNSIKIDESKIFASAMKKYLYKKDLRQLIELSYPDQIFYNSFIESWMDKLYDKGYNCYKSGKILNRAIDIYLTYNLLLNSSIKNFKN